MVENRQAGALVMTCVAPAVAALFVCARTFSRYLGRNFGWDDWLIHLALLLLLGQAITIYEFILVSHTGYHSKDVPKQTIQQQVYALKWSFAVQMFYHPMMGAARASVIMFLFRVQDQRWRIRWALHVVFWINMGYLVSTTLVNIFQCDPVRYVYLRPQMDHVDADGNIIKGGKCINSLEFIMSSCALSIFMDLIIMPIPTVIVWDLQMKRKTKMVVVAVMSMGWIATIASIARLVVYQIRFDPRTDRTYNTGVVTSITEPSLAIIAACAPACRRLLTLFKPRYFSDEGTSFHTYEMNNATYSRTRPRRSNSFSHDIHKEVEINVVSEHEVEMGFGMGILRGKESREVMDKQRMQSVTTGVSESTSQPYPTEPFDVLSQRQ